MDLPPEATQRQNITLPTDIVELFPQGDLGASQIESLVLASLKALRSATKQENQLEKQLNSAELLSRPIKSMFIATMIRSMWGVSPTFSL